MKLIITYEADFEDRESFETLFQTIVGEGLRIIPSPEAMRNCLPVTVQTVTRKLQFVNFELHSETVRND